MRLSKEESIRPSAQTVRKFWFLQSMSQFSIRSELWKMPYCQHALSLSLLYIYIYIYIYIYYCFKNSIVFWLLIDWRIIKIKLIFLALVWVAINMTKEISCNQKEDGNLASQEIKERTRIRPFFAENPGKEPSYALYLTLLSLRKILTLQSSPKQPSIRYSFDHRHLPARLLLSRRCMVNTLYNSIKYSHSTLYLDTMFVFFKPKFVKKEEIL